MKSYPIYKSIKGSGQNNELPGSDILVGGRSNKSPNLSTENLIKEIENIDDSSSSTTSSDIEYIEDVNPSDSSESESPNLTEISSFIKSDVLMSKTITPSNSISSSTISTSTNKYGAKEKQRGGYCPYKTKPNYYKINQEMYESDSMFSI